MDSKPTPLLAANLTTFVDVLLPLALPKPYTYAVSEEWTDQIKFGVRVEVQFGRSKIYSGIVVAVHNQAPDGNHPKPIISVIDTSPVVLPAQYQFWKWLADYYCCTIGEVLHAALPAHLKLTSETIVCLNPLYDGSLEGLDDREFLIAEALTIQSELTLEDVRQILNRKTVYPVIRQLIDKRILYLKEDLKGKYQVKRVACLRLQEPYATEPRRLDEAFEKLSRSNRQVEALLAYVQLSKKQEYVRKQDVYKMAKVDSQVIHGMVKKGVIEVYERDVSRLSPFDDDKSDLGDLSEAQAQALEEMKAQLNEKRVVLLHGVTGSGKTRLYMDLIRETINRNEQALYLLPEIALTTQLIQRLQRVFGDEVTVYHSRIGANERVEVWRAAIEGKPVIVGPRSALFLPFQKLRLVVVDEEHDPSYKQQDPNPRYHGRDAAIVLAHQHGAKVVLGSATPSVEAYHNCRKQKFGLVRLKERYGGLSLPEVVVADAKKEMQQQTLKSHFTSILLEELRQVLERNEQAILFQNRRGYAPTLRCETCDWHSECIHCDVSLTYHKHQNILKCHYCGFQQSLVATCPACGSKDLTLKGFGTQKVEDELQVFLPEAKIARMDLDTVRSRSAMSRLIHEFEEGKVDILVGTQMVTKGLDFDNVGLVGILSADQLLRFPDFRASERAFQLMTQVSGRAGRKKKQGKVILQAFNSDHLVIQDVLQHDFESFFLREIQERKEFHYPPFTRMIRITLRHRKPDVLEKGMQEFARFLKDRLGAWVIGPSVPYISRIRGYFLLDVLLKIEQHNQKLQFAKKTIWEAVNHLHSLEGLSSVRVKVDVDPG